METLELTENTVNPGQLKVGPQDFELLKVLGKGGYGKVSIGHSHPHLLPPLVLCHGYKEIRNFCCLRKFFLILWCHGGKK